MFQGIQSASWRIKMYHNNECNYNESCIPNLHHIRQEGLYR